MRSSEFKLPVHNGAGADAGAAAPTRGTAWGLILQATGVLLQGLIGDPGQVQHRPQHLVLMCPDGEVPWMVDDPILGGQGWVDAHIVLAEHGLPVRCRGHAVLSSPRTQPEQVRGTSEPRVESGHDARLTCWMSRHDTAAGPCVRVCEGPPRGHLCKRLDSAMHP